jgi:hypothetical protein
LSTSFEKYFSDALRVLLSFCQVKCLIPIIELLIEDGLSEVFFVDRILTNNKTTRVDFHKSTFIALERSWFRKSGGLEGASTRGSTNSRAL